MKNLRQIYKETEKSRPPLAHQTVRNFDCLLNLVTFRTAAGELSSLFRIDTVGFSLRNPGFQTAGQ